MTSVKVLPWNDLFIYAKIENFLSGTWHCKSILITRFLRKQIVYQTKMVSLPKNAFFFDSRGKQTSIDCNGRDNKQPEKKRVFESFSWEESLNRKIHSRTWHHVCNSAILKGISSKCLKLNVLCVVGRWLTLLKLNEGSIPTTTYWNNNNNTVQTYLMLVSHTICFYVRPRIKTGGTRLLDVST